VVGVRRLGEVVRTHGLLVVRSADDDPPDVGDTVLDDSLSEVGRVVDVFGPVERPYLAVTLGDDGDGDETRYLGEPLYAR
jgi:RNA-binding protein